jgi:hypothetical protein
MKPRQLIGGDVKSTWASQPAAIPEPRANYVFSFYA